MKTNKKAILGMLVAMVMSLGIMGGMNTKQQDFGIQQISLSAGSAAGSTESKGSYVTASTISGIAGCVAGYFYTTGFATSSTGVGAPVGLASFLLGGICTL